MSKLLSRKYLTAIFGLMGGIAISICGIFGLNTDVDYNAIMQIASLVSGCVVSICSVITYIHTEGKLDEAGIMKTINAGKDVVDTIEAVKKIVDEEEPNIILPPPSIEYVDENGNAVELVSNGDEK